MKMVLGFLFLGCLVLNAKEKIMEQKNCEVIKLSQLSTLVSCHHFDYLIEYQQVIRDDEDSVKKITAISPQQTQILKNSVKD
jgi:hypothetical protein